MILGEKITALRKKCGWSQEELASQLGISRQSVSKWESGASIPDMDKIITLSNLFGVSTDYLLRDELGEEIPSASLSYDMPEGRRVTVEEANYFLEQTGVYASKISFAVMLFVFSPVCLIFLAGLAENGTLNDNLAAGMGILILLVLVAVGVAVTVINSVSYSKYQYLAVEDFDTEYGVEGIVRKAKESFMPTYTKELSLGIILCILSVVPLILASMVEAEEWIETACISFLLLIVGFGVNQIVHSSIVYGGYQKLLKEGDYCQEEKVFQRKITHVSGAFWCIVTAVYLFISLSQNNWEISWVIWPVAALAYAAVIGIMRMILKNNVK